MQPFYLSDGPGRFLATPSSAGPWSTDSQHGGPPAALLARAIESLPLPEHVVGRFTMELLGPVPVGPLVVEASVVRPGRSVQMCEALLVDPAYDGRRGRPCARATAWLFPAGGPGPVPQAAPLPHTWADGVPKDPPASWTGGYLDAVEWRWVSGSVTEPGPGVVWMRPRVPLVDDEPPSAVQRLLACADSASGVSAALDTARWRFLNTELTVHLLRAPVGDWVCLEAETTLSSGRVGVATSRVSDSSGLVALSAQALLVAPTPGWEERAGPSVTRTG